MRRVEFVALGNIKTSDVHKVISALEYPSYPLTTCVNLGSGGSTMKARWQIYALLHEWCSINQTAPSPGAVNLLLVRSPSRLYISTVDTGSNGQGLGDTLMA
jgi:hypothetical protein